MSGQEMVLKQKEVKRATYTWERKEAEVKVQSCFKWFHCSSFFVSSRKQKIDQEFKKAVKEQCEEFQRIGGSLRALFRKHGLLELYDVWSVENDVYHGLADNLPEEGSVEDILLKKIKALSQHLAILEEFSRQGKVFIEEVILIEGREIKALQEADLLADIPLPAEAAGEFAKWKKDYRALCDRLCADFDVFKERLNEQIDSTRLFPREVSNIIGDYYYRRTPHLSLRISRE